MGMNAPIEAIVVGAGYAGVIAANRLAAHGRRVTLVSDGPDFVNRIRLHEYAAGARRAPTRPVRALVRRRVAVLDGRVVGIEPGRVTLADGHRLQAPHILVAAGSTARPRPTDGALEVASLAGAAGVAGRLSTAAPGTRVTVRGAGMTGIETAAEIAEAHPQVRVDLVDPAGPGSWLPPAGRRHVESTLTRLGVRLSGTAADGGIVIDCTGFRPAALAAASGLPIDDAGRLAVADDLGVPGHAGVWGAGDLVGVRGWPSQRMACAVAMPLAAHAADNIDAVLAGRDPRPFDLGFSAHCISLGRRDGLIAWTDPDDTATGRIWTGRRAAWAKETVCRLAFLGTHRGVRLYRWPRGNR